MNINDITMDRVAPPTFREIVEAIFERQKELMAKYKEIEQLPAAPVSLHTHAGQRVIKDFAWRTTEELTESYESFFKHNDRETSAQHALEELADSVHFFVELLVFAGITPAQCCENTTQLVPHGSLDEDPTAVYWEFTYRLGLAMNFLRNKAWKKSQVPTDEARFRAALLLAWHTLINLWGQLGCTQDDLFNYYFKKAAVNSFRQRSNY